MKLIRYIALALAALSLWACGSDGCTENTVAYAVASIEAGEGSAGVKPSSVAVYGIGRTPDSLMTSATSLTGLSLMLNPDTTVTRLEFVFRVSADTIRDTLTVLYSNRLFFLSIDCGCTVVSDIDTVLHTSHYVNSVQVINPEVTNEKKQNILLYY